MGAIVGAQFGRDRGVGAEGRNDFNHGDIHRGNGLVELQRDAIRDRRDQFIRSSRRRNPRHRKSGTLYHSVADQTGKSRLVANTYVQTGRKPNRSRKSKPLRNPHADRPGATPIPTGIHPTEDCALVCRGTSRCAKCVLWAIPRSRSSP